MKRTKVRKESIEEGVEVAEGEVGGKAEAIEEEEVPPETVS